VRDLAVVVVLVVVATLLVRAYVVAPFAIPSGSMENTLRPGDRVLVDRLSLHWRAVHRGDVVVFDGTEAFGSLDHGGTTDYVKRVIGLPGDRVACCDAAGRVTVNGVPLDESHYLYPGDAPSRVRFDVRVPPGDLWVMGDHRATSLDSRAHLGDPGGGFVPESRLIGRVLVVVWPWHRVGTTARAAAEAVPRDVGFAARQPSRAGTGGLAR
jgi:signal peptidase I